MDMRDYSKDYRGNPQGVKAAVFEWPVTGNVTGNVVGAITVPTATPASASAAGVAGQIVWDASYIYVCIAANTWKRVAIATW